MAGAGPEVGRVSVKVMPDTTGFKEKLRRDLQNLNDDIKINVTADTRRLRDEVDRATAKMPGAEVQVDFTADKRTVDAAIAGLRSKIAKIPTDLEMRKGWHEEIQAEIDAAKALGLQADLDASGVRAHLAATLGELQAAALLNPVEIPVQLDRNVLRNLAGSAISNAGDTVTGALKGISGLASGALTSMPAMLVAIAAAATLVAPAIALVAGSLTLIPAAVAGFATPIAAVILGLDGIKKAAEDAGLTSTTAGKRGGKGKTTVGEQLAELKKAVSGTFATELVKPFEKLNGVFETLTKPMQNVASGLSSIADGFVSAITSPKGTDQISRTIQNIGDGLRNAAPGVRDFTAGLLTLIDQVATRFPGMGTGFANLGKDFMGWVDKFTTKDAVTGVSQLDETLKTLKGTWDQIAGLGGDLLGAGMDWISDPDFGKSITGFFEDIRSFLSDGTLTALADGFVEVADSFSELADLADTIGGVFDFGKNITKIMQGDLSGVGGLIDQALGDGMGTADAGTKQGRKIAAELKAGIDEGIKAGNLIGVEDVVPPDIGAAISTQIATQITASADQQKQALRSAFTAGGVDEAVSGQLTQQVTAAVAGAKQAMVGLGPELQAQIDTAMLPLGTIAGQIGTAFSTVQANVSTSMDGVVAAVTSKMQSIPAIVSGALSTLGSTGTGAFTGLQTSAETAMTAITTAVVTAGAQAVTEVGSWPGRLTSAMGDLTGAFTALGQQVGAGLAAGITNGAGPAIAAATKLAADVEAASRGQLQINSPSKVFEDIGSGVGEGFVNGMDAKQMAVQKAAAQLAQSASDAAQGSIKMGGFDLGIKTGGLKEQQNQLKFQKDQLDLQYAQLQLDKQNAPDKAAKTAIQAQLTELNARRQQLTLQKDQLALGDQYGKQQSNIASTIDTQFNRMTSIPKDFAMANANQFMSDMGIGGGAITGGLMAGLDMASQYVFNISGIGEAMQLKDRLTNKQAVGVVGR